MGQITLRSGRPLRLAWGALAVAGLLFTGGCSWVKSYAVDTLGDAMSSGTGSVYSRDDDPELVKDSLPFALKTIEGLLEASPRHPGLLLAAASGFTQYSYAFVSAEADYVEAKDLEAATALRDRSLKLYRRAVEYGLRGLEVAQPGFRAELRADPQAALAKAKKEQVPLLYWTAAAWGSAISLALHDAELAADLSTVAGMMERALALDEPYGLGALHDFFIAYDGGRSAAAGGSAARAEEHMKRALELSRGTRVAPLVSYAETVCVGAQKKEQFTKLLGEALAFDVNRAPEQRLANLVSQKRARWLLGRADELFIE
ncbi:MAG: hypothetical protein HGA98_02790 [Deltaproteobacteria bacterium]|nr:hypothetical protein [Deltaproteobacteria bacterium]